MTAQKKSGSARISEQSPEVTTISTASNIIQPDIPDQNISKSARARVGIKRPGDGYKGHQGGSRKEQAHRLFDEIGPDAARPQIISSGIKRGTVTSWFAEFRIIGDMGGDDVE